MTINANSGAISWTPTEAQGPSTTVIKVVVADNNPSASDSPQLSMTNSFTVNVREVNSAPVFAAVPALESPDDTVLRLTFHATDSDLPANALTYELGANAPAGASIHPNTGELTWPIEVKLARETQVITVKVTDNGAPPLSVETSVTVTIIPNTVRFARIADRQVDEQGLLTLTAVVTNSPQALPPYTFALEGTVPEGASLSATTGVLFWRPTEVQGPSTNTLRACLKNQAEPMFMRVGGA